MTAAFDYFDQFSAEKGVDAVPPTDTAADPRKDTFAIPDFQLKSADDSSPPDQQERMRQQELAILQMKSWYLRSMRIPFISISVSPVTLLLLLLVTGYVLLWLYDIYKTLPRSEYCIASHILIRPPHHSEFPDTAQLQAALTRWEQRLAQWSSQIDSHYTDRFVPVAQKYSACPSGQQAGGYLGKFYRGQMAAPFEKACFDLGTPAGKTIGPIETQFGYHLIYIHERLLWEEPASNAKR
jgi:peptidyl-prolyl cis-trans isomerase C